MSRTFESAKELKSYIENGEFIYVIYSQYGCKIGYTKSPLERLEQIRLGLPSQKCIFIGLYIGDKARQFETKLHELFKKQRFSREWFYLRDDDNDEIERILIKNNFTCLIKQSIVWSNYLEPSIFIKGNIKIIESRKEQNTAKRIIQGIPDHISEILIKPDYTNLSDVRLEFLSATEIVNLLKKKGSNYSREQMGMILNTLGFRRFSKKIAGIGSRYGYYVIVDRTKI